MEERQAFTEQGNAELRSQIKRHLVIPGFVLSLDPETEEIPEEFFKEFREKFKALEEKKMSRSFWFNNREKLEGKVFSALISKVEKDRIEVLTPWGIETIALKDFDWAAPVAQKKDQPALTSAKEIF